MLRYSIIVPVYNSEQYITECIESVLEQSESSLELIMIDDGSDDNSLNIIQKFQERDSRIKIENTFHSGPGKARNIGIKRAEGEYILFLDSDDYLDRSYLKRLTEAIGEMKPDICFGSQHNDLFSDRVETLHYYNSEAFNHLLSKDDKIGFFFRDENRCPSSTWNNVYRREFIIENKIVFHEKWIFGEDTDFVFQALEKAEKLISNDINFYYYRKNNDSSLTNSLSYEKMIQRLEVLRKWYLYFLEESRERKQVFAVCESLAREYFNAFLLVDKIQQNKGKKEFLKRVHLDKEIWERVTGKKQRVIIWLMKLFGVETGIQVLNRYNKFRMKI